jgi:hypothetical protein
MKLFLAARQLLLMGIFAIGASAVPIGYDITFTALGVNPGFVNPTGSFQFDKTTGNFSLFIVSFDLSRVWDFDLTASANSPNPFGNSFGFFDSLISTSDAHSWVIDFTGFGPALAILSGDRFRADQHVLLPVSCGFACDHEAFFDGGFTVQGPPGTPEPSSIILTVVGGVFLVLRRRGFAQGERGELIDGDATATCSELNG